MDDNISQSTRFGVRKLPLIRMTKEGESCKGVIRHPRYKWRHKCGKSRTPNISTFTLVERWEVLQPYWVTFQLKGTNSYFWAEWILNILLRDYLPEFFFRSLNFPDCWPHLYVVPTCLLSFSRGLIKAVERGGFSLSNGHLISLKCPLIDCRYTR